jgi:hypothetical protein
MKNTSSVYLAAVWAVLAVGCGAQDVTGPSAIPAQASQQQASGGQTAANLPPAVGTSNASRWRAVLDGGPIGIQCPGGVPQVNPRSGDMSYRVEVLEGRARPFDIRGIIHYSDNDGCAATTQRPHPIHLEGKTAFAPGETGSFRGVINPADIPCGGSAQPDIQAIDSVTREPIADMLFVAEVIKALPEPYCYTEPAPTPPTSPTPPPTTPPPGNNPPSQPPTGYVPPPTTPPAPGPQPPSYVPPTPPTTPPQPQPPAVPPVTPPPTTKGVCELAAFARIDQITVNGRVASTTVQLAPGYDNITVYFMSYGSATPFPADAQGNAVDVTFPQDAVGMTTWTIRAGAPQTVSVATPEQPWDAWQVDLVCAPGPQRLFNRQTLPQPILEAEFGNNKDK